MSSTSLFNPRVIFSDRVDHSFPWGLTLGYQSYAKWSPVTINAGIGDAGYIYGDKGLVYNQTQFSGWMGTSTLLSINSHLDKLEPSSFA